MCKVPLKTKVLQYHLSGDLRRFQGDLVAQLLQAADRPALGSIVGLLFGMPWSQFTIGLLLMKQVIDDDQNAMGQSDDGFFYVPCACAVVGSRRPGRFPCSERQHSPLL